MCVYYLTYLILFRNDLAKYLQFLPCPQYSPIHQRINNMERELQTVRGDRERLQGLIREKEKEKDAMREEIRNLHRQNKRRGQIKLFVQSCCGVIALGVIAVVLVRSLTSTWASYPSYTSGLDVYRLVHCSFQGGTHLVRTCTRDRRPMC